MKILFLAPHPFFVGRGTPIREKGIIEALVGAGHEVDVLAYHEGRDPEISGCRIFRIPSPPAVGNVPPGISWKKLVCDPLLLVTASRRLRRTPYDLIHAVEESVFIARMVAGSTVPYVYDMHSSLPEQLCDSLPVLRPFRPLLDRVEATAIRGAMGVLTVCPVMEDRARRASPEGEIGRAEDPSLLPDELEGIARPADLPNIERGLALYVGNMHPYQGTELLVRGFARVAPRCEDLDLVLIGGSDRAIRQHRRLAVDLNVEDRVHLLGPRPPERLADYLVHADIVVSPRIAGTNTPMKIYSYLDSGTALLATRLETHTQVLHDEVAMLVPPTPPGIATGLERLVTDAGLRQRLGERGRRLARREFSREAFEKKVQNLYARVERGIRSESAVPSSGS